VTNLSIISLDTQERGQGDWKAFLSFKATGCNIECFTLRGYGATEDECRTSAMNFYLNTGLMRYYFNLKLPLIYKE
jgi:hypothetical protein